MTDKNTTPAENEDVLEAQGGPEALGRANAEDALDSFDEDEAFWEGRFNVENILVEWGFTMNTRRGEEVHDAADRAYIERFRELTGRDGRESE